MKWNALDYIDIFSMLFDVSTVINILYDRKGEKLIITTQRIHIVSVLATIDSQLQQHFELLDNHLVSSFPLLHSLQIFLSDFNSDILPVSCILKRTRKLVLYATRIKWFTLNKHITVKAFYHYLLQLVIPFTQRSCKSNTGFWVMKVFRRTKLSEGYTGYCRNWQWLRHRAVG